jgi:hypothetical protein
MLPLRDVQLWEAKDGRRLDRPCCARYRDDARVGGLARLCHDIPLKTGLETVCNRDERLPYRWQGLRIQFNLGGAVEQHPLE